MKTKLNLIEKASLSLKSELNQIKSPDFASRIETEFDLKNTQAKIFSFKPYYVAAALIVLSLNVSAVWFSWNTYSNEETQTELVDTLSVYESSWTSYLTLSE